LTQKILYEIFSVMTKLYKFILYSFIIYILLINSCTFFTTLNPKALVNPFYLKSRTVSCYFLTKHIVLKAGIFLDKASKAKINELVNKYSKRYGIDPELVNIMIKVESKYNQYAISRTGAMGLMQIMPLTFSEMGFEDPFDAEQNIHAGIKYFSLQKTAFDKLDLALSAYNAGPANVYKDMVVPDFNETKAYVQKILTEYKKIKRKPTGSD